jgi:hypothetical protein
MKYELTTISKGTIKTVDSFIKNFNAIGANMKALSVSAYKFLTDENKDVKIEFQKRVMDELKMSKTTLSFLKTAGYLYLLDDRFSEFAYTNVIYFKKAIEYFTKKNDCEINEKTLSTMFEEIALFSNSHLTKEDENYINYLVGLSQKELKNLIEKYVSRETLEEEETEEDTTEEVTEEDTTEEEPTSEEVEEQAKFYSIIDEDFDEVMTLLTEIKNNPKMAKAEIYKNIDGILDILTSIN